VYRLPAWNAAFLAVAILAQTPRPALAANTADKPTSSSAVAAALAVQTAALSDYRIGPLDKLNIVVFGVKELTVENLQVDASGQILLPLIGAVIARGKTTSELSGEIAGKLEKTYMQSPQVSVTVADTASQKVTVEGAVNEAGVFELKGRTSLLEAVARAKGMSKAANSHRVAIIRTVDGVPHAASFDLAAISAGKAANP
jgi:polysaccharide export outer membrane protein